MTDQEVYELLTKIDGGYVPGEKEKRQLSSINSITWSKISKLPESISMLSGLIMLDLEDTGISDISALSGLTGLTILVLGDTKVSDISALSGLTGLIALFLEKTQVSDISALSRLTGLTTLYLWKTQVSDISALSGLTGLTNLNLSFTQVSDISALSGLTGLTHLDLGYTRVSDISALSRLTGLIKLNLSNTGVSDISAISSLKNLKILNLQGLMLSSLPESLLDLDLNFKQDIVTIGPGIYIRNLTLTDQPVEIFSQDRELIRAYYRDHDYVPVNECKVVFLGDPEAGKTHSIRRLLRKGEKIKESESQSTPGIEITVDTMKLEGSDIVVNYWDFGGQEIQHSMHRMFLTERTIYVVFLNARQDPLDDRARYWLENICSFAKNAPVLLVINKMDQNERPKFNEDGITAEYECIKKIVRMSALKYNFPNQ